MKKKLTFALGGGGARGALQAGALRALVQAEIKPDLMVGTSIGSVNAIFMAMHGFSIESLNKLDETWLDVAKANLFPASTAWLTTQVLLNYVGVSPYHGIRDYFIAQGIRPAQQQRARHVHDVGAGKQHLQRITRRMHAAGGSQRELGAAAQDGNPAHGEQRVG